MGSPLSWTIYEPLKTLAVEKKFFSNLHFHSFYEGILLVVLRTSCWLLVGLKGGIDVLGNQTGWLFQGKPLNSLYFLYSPKFGFFKCKGEKKNLSWLFPATWGRSCSQFILPWGHLQAIQYRLSWFQGSFPPPGPHLLECFSVGSLEQFSVVSDWCPTRGPRHL